MTLKKFFVILLSVLTAACVLSLIACDTGNPGNSGYNSEDEIEEEYTITYVLDGGTLADDVIKKYKKPDADIALPIPTRIGYNFIGWKDDNGNFVSSLAAGTTGNKTFTAFWEAKPYVGYTLIFDNTNVPSLAFNDTAWAEDGSHKLKTITEIGEGDIVTPPKMVWDNFSEKEKDGRNYRVAGWYYYDDNNDKVYVDFSKQFELKNVSGDTITLYVYGEQNWTQNY